MPVNRLPVNNLLNRRLSLDQFFKYLFITNTVRLESLIAGFLREKKHKVLPPNYCIVLLIFVDSPTWLESLIAGVSNDQEHKKSAHWLMQGEG